MSAMDPGGATPFRDGWPLLQPTGFRLHPLEGKRPILEDWPNKATNDETILRQWGLQYGTYNIGIVLGHYPEQGRTYFVIDLDIGTDGTYGGDSLNTHRLAREEPALPPTLVQMTGSGGYHLFFFTESGLTIPNRVGILSGVDIRGDGGQVCTVPSIHPSTGVPYSWQSLMPVALAPGWVLELVGAYERGTQRRRDGKQDTAAEGDPIPEHERNDTLFKIASALRAKGLTRNAILGQLHDINEARCQPPLTLDELEWIADSVTKYDPGTGDLPSGWPNLPQGENDDKLPPPPGDTTIDEDLAMLPVRNTDRFNALEFASEYADRLIWTEQAGWLVWDGWRWMHDTVCMAELYADHFVKVLIYRLNEIPIEERETLLNRIKRLESKSGRDNMLALAKPRMARNLTDFDQDPWLVNFENGTLDFRTFRLRPPDPGDLLTRICTVEYHPDATDPHWEEFLELSLPDEDMRYTFQAFMGSCLTGATVDKSILLPHGETDTGKSTAVEPCYNVLGRVEEGGYAASWTADVVERGSRVSLDEKKNMARGARLIVVGELTRGARFNDGFVKQFSGGDTVSARPLYKASYAYRPQAKLVMHTNFVPRSSDRATQNRLKILPFIHKFDPRDPGVKAYFESNPEAQVAIAAWMVRGAQLWSTNGLGKMPWLGEIMHAYDLDSNPVAAFVEDVLEATEVEEESIQPAEMWQEYVNYELAQGSKPWKRRSFESALEERGLERKKVPRHGGTMRWIGFKKRYTPPPPGQGPYTV